MSKETDDKKDKYEKEAEQTANDIEVVEEMIERSKDRQSSDD